MTGNQIAYWKYAEDVRRNAEVERQGRVSLDEAKRHNLATEGLTARQIGLGYAQLAETKRANLAREVQAASELSELIRSNQTRETETERANKAREDENFRHNTSTEANARNQLDWDMKKHREEMDWKKQYVTDFETPIKIGQALLGFASGGFRLITPGV